MLLGQLYYYSKKLEDLKIFINSGNLNNLEIIGVDISKISQLETPNDRLEAIKNTFIKNYQSILDENNYSFASGFWRELTSFQDSTSLSLTPKTEFQKNILNINSLSQLEINEQLNEASMGDNEEDYAIAYGIKVLGEVDQSQEVELAPIDQENHNNLIQSPEIIIVSQSQYRPLFVNINCLFLDNEGSLSEITDRVSGLLDQHHTIKLILIDSQYQNTFNHIKRFLNTDVLISTMDLDSNQQIGYFDQVVKETLGIRLV